jgi:hypothetical protein
MAGIAVIFRRGVALNDVTGFMGLLVSLAALWHVLGFAFGLVYVQLSLKSLLNLVPYDRQWSMVIRTADLHLWLSGFVLILLGLLLKGALEYFSNPKLWCKITVVAVWFLSTQIMRRVGVPHLRKGKPVPMLRAVRRQYQLLDLWSLSWMRETFGLWGGFLPHISCWFHHLHDPAVFYPELVRKKKRCIICLEVPEIDIKQARLI